VLAKWRFTGEILALGFNVFFAEVRSTTPRRVALLSSFVVLLLLNVHIERS
jgi:hypothetical protein